MTYTLYIGNKNYSSWSMRPWLILEHFALSYKEYWVHFDDFNEQSPFKQAVLPLNPLGTVPILVSGDIRLTDSLAICEYLAEKHPNLPLWPNDEKLKASALNLVTYMHNGFLNIRRRLPMNIEADLPEIGQIAIRDDAKLNKELVLFDSLLTAILAKNHGSYLFGEFSIADAFYAPMCLRMHTYHIPLSDIVQNYIKHIIETPCVKKWIDEALLENEFVIIDEPFRIKDNLHTQNH